MSNKRKNRLTILSSGLFLRNAPREIRTPVLGLKGPRPSPLDDGGELDENSIIGLQSGQAPNHLFCTFLSFAHLAHACFVLISYNYGHDPPLSRR